MEVASLSPGLIEILRSTLVRVEQKLGLSPHDSAVVELRHSIVRMITELEIAKARETEKEQDSEPEQQRQEPAA